MENENKRGEFIVCPECKNKYDVQTEFCTFCGCLLEKKEENLSDKLEKAYNQAYNETTDKRPMNYKKIGTIAAVVVCIAIIVTVILSNSKRTGAPMNQIKTDISELPVVTNGVIECEYTPFTPYTVDSVEIDKRQTNVEDKEDIVYCNVGISNEYYQTELQIKLVYNYYDDGGWINDESSIVKAQTVPIAAVDAQAIDDIYIEIKEKEVTLSTDNIKSVKFDKATNSSTIHYEYSDEVLIVSGEVTILFKDNEWEEVYSENFVLNDLKINWASNVFVSSTSGKNEYWSYLHKGTTKTQGIGTLYYVKENQKADKDAYYHMGMPNIKYELSITSVSAEDNEICGYLSFTSDKYHDYYQMKGGSIKIPFKCKINPNTGGFIISKTLDVLSYRCLGYLEPIVNPTYKQVDVSFEVIYRFNSNRWYISEFRVDKVHVGNNLLCDWKDFQDNTH